MESTPTSSKTGTLYLAFGSNLSPTQMRGRLDSDPSSSIPVGIARLDGWHWIICKRGYANIVEVPNFQNTISISTSKIEYSHASTVWGVLYNLSPSDEEILDAYEGHNHHRNPHPMPNSDTNSEAQTRKPLLQGNWDYNKLYLPVTVTQWLLDPKIVLGIEAEAREVRTLVYVDEKRVDEGEINALYIGRMNRAIDEGVGLGLPGKWCESVMRRWVTKGVYPPDHYFGTEEGYIEDGDDA